MTCKSTLLCNLPGTFSLDNYTCNCMSLGKTYSLQCFLFFLISIKLLQSTLRFTERAIKCFFSFFYCYSYSLSSAIPYNRPNLHSYHHERIPPFQFTVILMFTILSAVHILHYLFAIYTAGVHVRGNASNDASNPRPPSPRSVYAFFL